MDKKFIIILFKRKLKKLCIVKDERWTNQKLKNFEHKVMNMHKILKENL